VSNYIDLGARPDLAPVKMSNSMTYVFLSTLSMALSEVARTDREIRMAIWVASHDQSVLGDGWMDFDVADLPWSAATFDSDKAVVLSAVDLALAKFGWDRLGHEPREDWLLDCLRGFRTLVAALEVRHLHPPDGKPKWALLTPSTVERCERHGAYQHAEGCIVCNDPVAPR
jgi:hypothetical protein